MSSSNYTVIYLPGFSGRSEPVLLLLEQAGVNWKLDTENVTGFIEANPTVFAVPALVDGSTVVSQTAAILFYLGKKLGFLPENEALGIQISLDFTDLWSESYFAKTTSKDEDGFLGARLPKWLSVLEALKGEGKYFFGEKLTYVDFHGLSIFNVLEFMYGDAARDQIKTKPKISSWLAHVRALPSVQL